MILQLAQFEELKRYLLYDKKLMDNHKNVVTLQSRFRVLCALFAEREFNRNNFLHVIEYMKEKGYSNAYINVIIVMAKHIDAFYKLHELEDFTLYPKEEKMIDVLTADQFTALAEVKLPYSREEKETNAKYRAIIYIMFYTGARITEVLTLRWQDLREGAFPILIFNQTKINELRYAPIPLSLYADLTALPHYGGLIFSSREGKALDRSNVGDDLKARAKACGIEKRVYNHLLRHSFINIMLRNGAKLHEVSRLVGHKTLETTNRHYVHLMIEELNDVLHAYHPALKKSQTLDSVTKRIREMCINVLDTDRFNLNVFKREGRVNIEIREIE